MAALATQKGMAALALRFAILTAARTGEVLGMTWGELDLSARLWTVSAGRMKGKREHRVPLSVPAAAAAGRDCPVATIRRRSCSRPAWPCGPCPSWP